MTKKENPRNWTISVKITKIEINQIKNLADAEHTTASNFIRKCLTDRINFEAANGNPALENQDYLPMPKIKNQPAPPAAPQTAQDSNNTPGDQKTP
jgi:hypothetical protein